MMFVLVVSLILCVVSGGIFWFTSLKRKPGTPSPFKTKAERRYWKRIRRNLRVGCCIVFGISILVFWNTYTLMSDDPRVNMDADKKKKFHTVVSWDENFKCDGTYIPSYTDGEFVGVYLMTETERHTYGSYFTVGEFEKMDSMYRKNVDHPFGD